jgi:hypothetical protein
MMSLSFLFIAFAFPGNGSLLKAIRWIFLAGSVLTFLSLVLISIRLGVRREYLFEIAAITFNWMVLIVNGLLLARLFKRSFT